MPQQNQILRKSASSQLVATEVPNRYRVVASTDDVDSTDEVMTQDWDLKRFQSGGPVHWNHDTSSLPIGTFSEADVQGTKSLGGILEFDLDDPLAQRIKAKVDKGLIRGISVGFRSKSARMTKVDGKNVVVLSGNELLEVSLTTIPANSNAFIEAAKSMAVPATETPVPEATQPSVEVEVTDVTSLQVLTKATTPDQAHGIVMAWKSAFESLPAIQAQLKALQDAEEARVKALEPSKKAVLIEGLLKAGKATPISAKAMESWPLAQLESYAEVAPVVLNQAAVTLPDEPNTTTKSANSFNGKSLDQLVQSTDWAELAQLKSHDSALFQRVMDARGVPRTTTA